MFDVQIWQIYTSLESSCALLLESAKKLQIYKNWIFYRKIQSYSKNVCKKNLSKKWKIIHIWKALDHAISNMQKFLKLKMCKFPLTDCLQKNLLFFFAKLVQSVFLWHRLSKKLNLIKFWQVKVDQNKDLDCYRQKQSFRQCAWGLRQLVLKPSFRPKGRALGM